MICEVLPVPGGGCGGTCVFFFVGLLMRRGCMQVVDAFCFFGMDWLHFVGHVVCVVRLPWLLVLILVIVAAGAWLGCALLEVTLEPRIYMYECLQPRCEWSIFKARLVCFWIQNLKLAC